MFSIKKSVLLFFSVSVPSLILFSGCAGVVPEPSVALSDARSRLEAIERAVPESMRIMSRVDYVDGTAGRRVVGQDLVLSVNRDGFMRITISAFDKAVSTLVSDGTMLGLIDVSQNVFAVGHATSENISRILSVRLSGADFHRVLHGMYPTDGLADDAASRATFVWDGAGGGYRLDLPMADGGTESVYRSWPDGDIIKMTVRSSGGRLQYSYEASDFRRHESEGAVYRFPDEITFRMPEQGTDVRLRVRKRDIGVEFSDAVFRLMPPKGARIVFLDEMGTEHR